MTEDDFNREMASCQKELAKPLLEIYEYAKKIQEHHPEGIDLKLCDRSMKIFLQKNDIKCNLTEINPFPHRDKPGPNVAFYEPEKDFRKDSKGLQTLIDIGMISESDIAHIDEIEPREPIDKNSAELCSTILCDLLSKFFPGVKKSGLGSSGFGPLGVQRGLGPAGLGHDN